MDDLTRKRIQNDHLYGKFSQAPEEKKMDIFDKMNGFLDDFNIGVENVPLPGSNLEEKMEAAKKAAKFLAIISDPEEREKAILEGLKQAYQEGLKSK